MILHHEPCHKHMRIRGIVQAMGQFVEEDGTIFPELLSHSSYSQG